MLLKIIIMSHPWRGGCHCCEGSGIEEAVQTRGRNEDARVKGLECRVCIGI